MPIDISEDVLSTPVGDLQPVVEQARRLYTLDRDIKKLKDDLTAKVEERRLLAEETLPELMDSVSVTTIPLGDDWKIEVEPVFRANIPAVSTIEAEDDAERRGALEARRADGFKWLRGNKGEPLIKDTIKIELGKGEGKLAKQFAALAKKLKVVYTRSEFVHPASLGKFIREKLEAGVSDVPLETFAVFRGREAKLVAPKKAKQPEGPINHASSDSKE